MLRLLAVIALALLFTKPSSALAQAYTPPLSKGDVIRGKVAGQWVQGTLVEAPTAALPLSIRTSTTSNPTTLSWDVVSLERRIRVGRRNHGALMGALIGLATGAVIGLMSGDDEHGFLAYSTKEKAVIYGSAGAELGAIIGAITAPGARWAPINRADLRQAPSYPLELRHLRIQITF